MANVTVSTRRNRVYERKFDHELAREMREDGMSYGAIAEHFGVTVGAVSRICDPRVRARMQAHTNRWVRENNRKPCLGECGRLVWKHRRRDGTERSGYCVACYHAKLAAERDDIREGELRCLKCGEWKPDDEFPPARRGRKLVRRAHYPWCRPCCSAARRDYRHRHPESAHDENQRTRKRRSPPMQNYVVLKPHQTQAGVWVTVDKINAASPQHAVEQAAELEGQPGSYVAIHEDRFVLLEVEPVQAFRVKKIAKSEE